MKRKALKLAMVLVCMVLMISGCGESEGGGPSYTLGEVRMPQYAGVETATTNAGEIDFTNADEGYIMAMYQGDVRGKLQIANGEEKYNYDIENTGEYEVFPLQMGNGAYTVKLLENVGDDRYAVLLVQEIEVNLTSDFASFLIPNQMVNYTENSQSVVLARELAKNAVTDVDVVKAVYAYIKDNVVYDLDKAGSIKDGYIPVIDETFETNKGICFDYASMAAAMLRACGIPTKVETGYVSPSGVYHAWNIVYLENAGWVEVGFHVDKNDWSRLDLTFAASSSKADLSKFIGDNGTYEKKYTY